MAQPCLVQSVNEDDHDCLRDPRSSLWPSEHLQGQTAPWLESSHTLTDGWSAHHRAEHAARPNAKISLFLPVKVDMSPPCTYAGQGMQNTANQA